MAHPNEDALILAPTRELAMQIHEEFLKVARGLGVKAMVAVGGANIRNQIQRLEEKPQIVTATPGRLKDLMQRRAWRPHNVHTVILDEVDRMLDIGFIKDIEQILGALPQPRQSMFFSATLPPEVEAIMQRFAHDPATVSVKTRETAASVAQEVVHTEGKDSKVAALVERLRTPAFDKVIIFTRTKRGADRLAKALYREQLKVEHIHGDRSQNQRVRALKSFKDGKVQALIATDIAARGIDVPKVSHVINFDLPSTYEDYVHRIGRTGRADQTGHAITFIDAADHNL
jgi:superfamily II DNA/RNA helicase